MTSLKEKVALAVDAVEGVPFELKQTAFEMVLKTILNTNEISTTITNPLPQQVEIPEKVSVSTDITITGLVKLASDINRPLEDLHQLFDVNVDTKEIIILKPISSGKNSEKQAKTALMYLTAKKYIFGEDNTDSRELARVLKRLGIGSLAHLSKNIATANSMKNQVLLSPNACKGEGISGYKITAPGLIEGKEIIKSLILNGN